MRKGRIEAFSDGVLAIIVTIMVLELKVPEGAECKDLSALIPKFLSYVLSFMMVLIYWNNHHHMFQTVKKVDGKILLANGALLFFLSLLPFATAWMGETHFRSTPVALMGIVLLLSGTAYLLLVKTIVDSHGQDSILANAIGTDYKGNISWIGYLVGIFLSRSYPQVSAAIYLVIALMWFIPDKRIERLMHDETTE